MRYEDELEAWCSGSRLLISALGRRRQANLCEFKGQPGLHSKTLPKNNKTKNELKHKSLTLVTHLGACRNSNPSIRASGTQAPHHHYALLDREQGTLNGPAPSSSALCWLFTLLLYLCLYFYLYIYVMDISLSHHPIFIRHCIRLYHPSTHTPTHPSIIYQVPTLQKLLRTSSQGGLPPSLQELSLLGNASLPPSKRPDSARTRVVPGTSRTFRVSSL